MWKISDTASIFLSFRAFSITKRKIYHVESSGVNFKSTRSAVAEICLWMKYEHRIKLENDVVVDLVGSFNTWMP